MQRFVDKVVVITGASSGIGEAAALRFAAEGARLVLASRNRSALEAVAAEVKALGGECVVAPADVADLGACDGLVEASVERFEGIDVLVNNAGMHLRGNFDQHGAEGFAAMVDVNLRAPIVLTSLCLPHLRRSRGAVVNVASVAGLVPLPGAAVYSSTKFGMRAFSLALADEERAAGVRVALVSPGPVETGFILDDLDSVSPLALSQPMSSADEIAALILDAAADGRPERVKPRLSGKLATLSYLVPVAGRLLRPLMARRGERTRQSYLRRRQASKG